METKTEIADIKESKTEGADKPSDTGKPDASSLQQGVSRKGNSASSSQTAGPIEKSIREFVRELVAMKRWHWALFVVICVILGCLVLYTILHMINTTTSMARHVHAPSPVETVPVHRQTLDEVIGGSGSIEQAETVNLITQLTAQVLEVPVKIGDLIKKGDLLVRWDDRLIKATVDANRQYVEADKIKIRDETRQVERYSTLQTQNMGTAVELEKYEMALADAKIDLAKSTISLTQAEIDLEHVKQMSPIDGIVLERLVNPNEFTKPGQVIMKLGVLNTVLMAAKITEEKMHSVQLGLPAEVTFPAFPSEIFKGTVFKIDPNIDPITRTFTAYVKIQNPDFRLKPGLSGFARIRRTAKDVLAVPSIAIMNPSGEQASVFVVDSTNHAKLHKVRPGIVVDAMTEITDGLNEGDKVVTVGQFYLKDDDKIHTTFRSIFK
jgi:RND family efflux transporter MFP subunit